MSAGVNPPAFSALCETDRSAYLAYLSEYSQWNHRDGQHTGVSGRCYGACCWGEDGCRCADSGGCAHCSDTRRHVGRSGGLLALDACASRLAIGSGDCFDDRARDTGESAEVGAAGVSPCGVVGGVSGMAGDSRGVDSEDAAFGVGQSHSLRGGLPRGPNFARNQANREKRKRSKAARAALASSTSTNWRVGAAPLDASGEVQGGGVVPGQGEKFGGVSAEAGLAGLSVPSVPGSDSLRASLDAKRIAENRLAEAQAKRRLAVLEANDVEPEVRRYRTRVSAMTEQNMVSIERTHAELRKTGNLAGEAGGGFAETVVSGDGLTNGDTISPNSSASVAEFRKCQKSLLDSEARVKELTAALERFGISVEHLDKYDKSVWTCDEENLGVLDAMYDDYAFQAVPGDDVHVRLLGHGKKIPPREQPADHAVRKCSGELYSSEEAMRWLGKFAFLGARLDKGESDEQVVASLSQPLEVAVKYRALRAKFLGDTLV